MANKKVGVLGSGVVGRTLASGFIKHGFDVMIGTRDTAKLSEWLSKEPKGKVGSTEVAAQFGDIIVLAVKGSAAEATLKAAGADNLKGKTIIDATNPISDEQRDNTIIKYFTNLNESLMEKLQTDYPEANFVKAFCSVGSGSMVNPDYKGIKPTMFICGNNESAKKEVTSILDKFGWETEDMGKAEGARAIEPLAILWCIPGFSRNEWTHAFKLLKR